MREGAIEVKLPLSYLILSRFVICDLPVNNDKIYVVQVDGL